MLDLDPQNKQKYNTYKEESVDDNINQYRQNTKQSFTENELEKMKYYLFKKKNRLKDDEEIVYFDIEETPLKKGNYFNY